MKNTLRPVLVLFAALVGVTGVAYPAFVTAFARVAFPDQAGGSLITRQGKVVGSRLIGQQFDAPYYFWGRLSATAPNPYNASASGGSNLGPTNPALVDAIKGRIAALRAADSRDAAPGRAGPGQADPAPIPVDLVTSSASGLDPEISPAAALYQMPRVARARGLAPERVRALIAEQTQGRQLGVLGEPRVNVLALNLALDAAQPGFRAASPPDSLPGH
ncbi:potassium-transporting ATPase subunit KdpC [Robbsia sp. Bb-Pol-6]|uniref:Potassium-transporting ATPase KdpC subunit n=1 Tax=Robbsia betulipollinis TaxID=2981849 RepID=A0ABT3ZJJ9_9BURK|nr:potassium-transporting ATPase subunit KdpC [Robbsia betulipollinis]MCY0386699.1 potassium-transporting ATPase subunit KdpC [Robbsia betulipollinis]